MSEFEGGAPTQTQAAVPSAVTSERGAMDAFVRQMLGRMSQSHLGAPPGGPSQQPQQAPQPYAKDQFEMGQKVATDIMRGVQMGVQQQKQKQVNEATAMWMTLQAAHERLTMTNQVNPDGTVDLMKDPMAAAILSDPKKMKNMAKAFQVDMLNPEKTNVYAEGLKKAMKLDKAGKMVKMLRSLHMSKQVQPNAQQADPQAMGGEIGRKIEGMTAPGGADPKLIESMARISESAQAHEDNLEFRRQAHVDQLKMQEANLQMHRDQMEMLHQDRAATRESNEQYHRELLDLRRQELDLKREIAETTDDVSSLKEAVEKGYPITMITPKMRNKVASAFQAEGKRVPTPFSPAENQILDDSLNQISRMDAWKAQLEGLKGGDGKLPNTPMANFTDRLKYWAGRDTPQSAMISDFSRERWAAIGGLVKGVRRGDILKDMIQHTPDPWKDSIALQHTKIEALEANYRILRATALKEHGLTNDPVTGDNLDDTIASYQDHLKTAVNDLARQGTQKFEKYKVK